MSRIYSAGQYEASYLPHRLGNWETPAVEKLEATSHSNMFSTLRARSGKTRPVVDERGHLLPGVPKVPNSAFNVQQRMYERSSARWPQPNTCIKAAGSATMGYKGITTSYLPTSTVTTKTVQLPGARERLFQ